MNEKLHRPQQLKNISTKYALRLAKTTLLIVLLAVFTGIYIGVLSFGEHGIDVYIELSSRASELRKDIARLNQINAKLQKEYFELKSIQGNQ